MALQGTVSFKGIEVPNTYVKIIQVGLIKTETEQFNCSIRIGERLITEVEFFSYSYITFPFDLNGANPFIQGYEYLKTLPEFNNLLDV